MKANISEDELKLLAYLHEHVKGFGEAFQVRASEVAVRVLSEWARNHL